MDRHVFDSIESPEELIKLLSQSPELRDIGEVTAIDIKTSENICQLMSDAWQSIGQSMAYRVFPFVELTTAVMARHVRHIPLQRTKMAIMGMERAKLAMEMADKKLEQSRTARCDIRAARRVMEIEHRGNCDRMAASIATALRSTESHRVLCMCRWRVMVNLARARVMRACRAAAVAVGARMRAKYTVRKTLQSLCRRVWQQLSLRWHRQQITEALVPQETNQVQTVTIPVGQQTPMSAFILAARGAPPHEVQRLVVLIFGDDPIPILIEAVVMAGTNVTDALRCPIDEDRPIISVDTRRFSATGPTTNCCWAACCSAINSRARSVCNRWATMRGSLDSTALPTNLW